MTNFHAFTESQADRQRNAEYVEARGRFEPRVIEEKEMSEKTILPKAVDGLGVMCGDIGNLPSWASIPDEFKAYHSNSWCQLASRWFFCGLADPLVFKPEIDGKAAMSAVASCLRSFSPKHEHKIAGVGYLLSLWCEPSCLEIKAADKAEAAP